MQMCVVGYIGYNSDVRTACTYDLNFFSLSLINSLVFEMSSRIASKRMTFCGRLNNHAPISPLASADVWRFLISWLICFTHTRSIVGGDRVPSSGHHTKYQPMQSHTPLTRTYKMFIQILRINEYYVLYYTI
jgi:hypothetical protein